MFAYGPAVQNNLLKQIIKAAEKNIRYHSNVALLQEQQELILMRLLTVTVEFRQL